MSPENDTAAAPPPRQSRDRASTPRQATGASWLRALGRAERWVPPLAVVLVAATAVATALMSSRFDDPVSIHEPEAPADPAHVVQAPPLKATPPSAEQIATPDSERVDTATMGGPHACRNCGVVEMVVAVHGYAQPKASGYQMHIRMDDGSVQTVEQRGALAAGSRVVVDRGAVRVLGERAGQG